MKWPPEKEPQVYEALVPHMQVAVVAVAAVVQQVALDSSYVGHEGVGLYGSYDRMQRR